MSVADFISFLQENGRFSPYISSCQRFEGKDSVFADSESLNLPAKIQSYLDRSGISLYSHQAESLKAIRKGEDVILCTPTASGKTLAFYLPFCEMKISDPTATAMALYPAKALTRDQLRSIERMSADTGIGFVPSIYDGDTPRSERAGIRSHADFLLTNPFELHHILSWHHQWESFFRRLRFIVIDEAHLYRGVFGGHMALLIRRLLRICSHYGSDPRIFLSSATLANPESFSFSLTGRECRVINESGAPRPDRYFILYNPYSRGMTERSLYSEGALLLAASLESGLQTLCFTGSRKMAELVSLWGKERLNADNKVSSSSLASYRAGYRQEERRELENRFKSGQLKGIVSTSALELGIDIGSLDTVILIGFPGTMMSVWQQAGRAGRSGVPSLAVLVAFQNPLDQYYLHHPEFFFSKPHEHAIIDIKNPYILSGQLLCAASELPLDLSRDHIWFGPQFEDITRELEQSHLLTLSKRGYVYSGRKRAPELVTLNNTSGDTWTVEESGKVLETLDTAQAYREAHPGAVLLHQGEKYIILRWDSINHRIFGEKQDPEYYTRVDQRTSISILRSLKRRALKGGCELCYGEVCVSQEFFGYRKILGNTTIGREDLNLPPLSFPTRAIWITVPQPIITDISGNCDDLAGGLHGAEHALIAMIPYYVLCDRWDLGGMSTPSYDLSGEAMIFIYDGFEGGIGLAEQAYGIFEDLSGVTQKMVSECQCKEGCPACIHSPKCGNDNQPLDKRATIQFLEFFSGKKGENRITSLI